MCTACPCPYVMPAHTHTLAHLVLLFSPSPNNIHVAVCAFYATHVCFSKLGNEFTPQHHFERLFMMPLCIHIFICMYIHMHDHVLCVHTTISVSVARATVYTLQPWSHLCCLLQLRASTAPRCHPPCRSRCRVRVSK